MMMGCAEEKEREGRSGMDGWIDGGMGGWGDVHGYREEGKKERKKERKDGKRKKDVLNKLTHARTMIV